MRTPTIRTSRGIRSRIAKRKSMRTARRIEIDRKGLVIEGERFPYYVGADVRIRRFGEKLTMLGIEILADHVEVRRPLHRQASITETWP